MSLSHARIFSRLINVPLLCLPRAAVNFYNGLCGHFGTLEAEVPDGLAGRFLDSLQFAGGEKKARDGVSARTRGGPSASRFEGEMVKGDSEGFPRVEPFMLTRDGTAIISVVGELVNRGAWVGSQSGMTSYEGVKFQLARAARSGKAKNIVLDIHSPGGEAVGAFEIADLVRQIGQDKPVFASVNGMAASAAYAIASGAKRVVTTRTGLSGSIGVVLLHMDVSGAAEQKGVKPTLIFAGEHKVDGNPFQPLSDEVRGDLQAEVNAFYQGFLDTVAAGRGRRLSKRAARETEARTYIGSNAVEVGLADAVGTFDDVVSEANQLARRSSAKLGAKANAYSA